MPNWCGNVLTIVGEREALDALAEAVKGADDDGEPLLLSFETIAPTPAVLLPRKRKTLSREHIAQLRAMMDMAQDESAWEPFRPILEKAASEYPDPAGDALAGEFGEDNWEDWRTQHWGTPFHPRDVRVILADGDLLRYRFSTAYYPPRQVVEALSAQFDTLFLHLLYEDWSTDRAGFVACRAGERLAWSEGSWGSALMGGYNFRRELVDLLHLDRFGPDFSDRVFDVLYADD